MEEGSRCVLLLHPYGSCGKVFEKKSASFLKLMGLKAAVVAPDAPHRMDGKEDANRWFRFGGVDPSIDAPIGKKDTFKIVHAFVLLTSCDSSSRGVFVQYFFGRCGRVYRGFAARCVQTSV